MAERYRPARERLRCLPPALKHGAYSGTSLLPNEDPRDFAILCGELFAEYLPVGRHEKIIVETIARLVWRKQNLKIYRVAEEARRRHSQIRAQLAPKSPFQILGEDLRDPDEVSRAEDAADEKARKELGWAWDLIDAGDLLTTKYLMAELEVIARIDSMIALSMKQLLYVRGFKSLAPLPSTGASPQLLGNGG
jgi:hypothetical protein